MAYEGAGIILTYTAWNTTLNAGQSADAGNHSLRWVLDGVLSTPTNTPTEVHASNPKGEYNIVLTKAETLAVFGKLVGISSTPNVIITPVAVHFVPHQRGSR